MLLQTCLEIKSIPSSLNQLEHLQKLETIFKHLEQLINLNVFPAYLIAVDILLKKPSKALDTSLKSFICRLLVANEEKDQHLYTLLITSKIYSQARFAKNNSFLKFFMSNFVFAKFAVQQFRGALEFVSEDLRKNPELIKLALKQE